MYCRFRRDLNGKRNPDLDPAVKAKIEGLPSLGVMVPEIDTSSREIISASPETPVTIKFHTDSAINLRIRILESPPKTEQKLLHEMHISTKDDCGQPYNNHDDKPFAGPLLRISLNQNDTLALSLIAKRFINVINVFLHQSRIFYINFDSDGSSHILSDRGQFVSSLPSIPLNTDQTRISRTTTTILLKF